MLNNFFKNHNPRSINIKCLLLSLIVFGIGLSIIRNIFLTVLLSVYSEYVEIPFIFKLIFNGIVVDSLMLRILLRLPYIFVYLIVIFFIYKLLQKSFPKVFAKRNKNSFNNSISIPQQLRELSKLKDDGIITETEFESRKQELLKKS